MRLFFSPFLIFNFFRKKVAFFGLITREAKYAVGFINFQIAPEYNCRQSMIMTNADDHTSIVEGTPANRQAREKY